MSVFKRGKVWWYEFWFAGRRIQESTKATSKTVAKLAEQKRRRELEEGFNSIEDRRDERIRTIKEVAKDYLEGYLLRNRSGTFAEYAIGHLTRLLGARMIVDADESMVLSYQEQRLKEKAAPKTINEEVGFLLRLLGERGELIRAHLRKQKALKLKGSKTVAKAYSPEEKQKLVEASREARSPTIYPALTLALNAGMRSAEIRHLRWNQVDLKKQFLIVGKSKTEAGEGRTIPLNAALLEALRHHAEWYTLRFGKIEPEWYLFPFGRANHLDPTRPITTIKTAWANAKERAGVTGRLHDSRHTLITELAESGAGDQTIMDIAGHVSRQMLKHYSHIRMQAKREALEAVWKKQQEAENKKKEEDAKRAQECSPVSAGAQEIEGESLQKSLQSGVSGGRKHLKRVRKSLKRIGSPCQTKGVLRSGDTGKHVESTWVTQMQDAPDHRPTESRPSPDARVIALPRLGDRTTATPGSAQLEQPALQVMLGAGAHSNRAAAVPVPLAAARISVQKCRAVSPQPTAHLLSALRRGKQGPPVGVLIRPTPTRNVAEGYTLPRTGFWPTQERIRSWRE